MKTSFYAGKKRAKLKFEFPSSKKLYFYIFFVYLLETNNITEFELHATIAGEKIKFIKISVQGHDKLCFLHGVFFGA